MSSNLNASVGSDQITQASAISATHLIINVSYDSSATALNRPGNACIGGHCEEILQDFQIVQGRRAYHNINHRT